MNPYPSQFNQATLDKLRDIGRSRCDMTPGYENEDYGCHEIAPMVQATYPEALHESGIVLDPDAGETLPDGTRTGYYDHHWNVLPNGDILDATRRKYFPGGHPDYIPYGELSAAYDPVENYEGFNQWRNQRTSMKAAIEKYS